MKTVEEMPLVCPRLPINLDSGFWPLHQRGKSIVAVLMARLGQRLLLGVSLAALAVVQGAQAQQAQSTPAQKVAPVPYITPELTSGVAISETYSDNIYATRTAKISDWITQISPFVNLNLKGDKGEANIGGRADIGRYAQHSDENYNDYWLYTDGRYNYSSMLTFSGGAAYDHLHELRSSPNARPGVTPTTYDVARAFGGALLKFGQNSVRFGATYDHFDYNNVPRVGGGTVINDDRDRNVTTAGVRVGHSLNASDELFGSLSVDDRNYRLPVDDFGYQKSSSGVRFSSGVRHQVTSTLDGEVYAGGLYQRYDDPRFGAVFVPDFGGRLRWTGVPDTTFTASLDRTLLETDIQGSSGYIETLAALRIFHWIRPNLRVEGFGSYALDQFNAISRTDQVQSYGMGIRNYLTPHFYVAADLTRTVRDSTDLTFSYTESRAMVRAGLVQKPAYEDAEFKAPEVPKNSDGRFYAGIQTGIGSLGTKLEGSRGASGTLQADFGDENWSNAVFAGWGLYIGNWYVGLEADASKASGGWDHAHVPGERIFSVSRDYEYGLSGVIGRTLVGGSMIYGKAGVVEARFDTNYQLNNRGTNDKRSETGIRLGIGASTPITRELAVRLEHTYSAYNSYDIACCIAPPGGTPDNFTNDGALTSIGLTYTFGGIPGPMQSANINYTGAYVGGQIGHDALSTWSTGPRDGGTTLTASFGDLGYTGGIFGGYGVQLGSLYVGGELEAELGRTHNDHEREGGGQTFAIGRQWSYGAGLRAGYVVNNTALLYARAGVVGTRFQADFSRGSRSLSAQYDETGFRYGGGMELPVAANFIARFDYTHTSYPEFTLTTPPSGDVNRFRPNEDLFRIGMLYKFDNR